MKNFLLKLKLKWKRHTKLIIGSGGIKAEAGWIGSDISGTLGDLILNATQSEDWERYFHPGTLTHIFSEHVLEHLDDHQLENCLSLCSKYLASGGRLRIAVPDGYRTDLVYLEEVAPPADGHLQLFSVDTLCRLLEEKGFLVVPLEYYDQDGKFHWTEWDVNDGFVRRSYKYDRQEAFKMDDHYYTSLIVDAFKRD